MYIFENNLGREQDHLTNLVTYIKRLKQNSVILCEDPSKIGLHTDYARKLVSDNLAMDYVSAEAISFAPRLITTNPLENRSAAQCKTILMNQFREYREYTITPPNGVPKIFRSCRHTPDLKPIRDKRDDLIMVFKNMLVGEKLHREQRVANSIEQMENIQSFRQNNETAEEIMQRLKMMNMTEYYGPGENKNTENIGDLSKFFTGLSVFQHQ